MKRSLSLRQWFLVVAVGATIVSGGLWTWSATHHRVLSTATKVTLASPFLTLVVGVVTAFLPTLLSPKGPRSQDLEEALQTLARKVRTREREERAFLLGNSARAIDVAFSVERASVGHAVPSMATGDLSSVLALYRGLPPWRLVITGAAGAGKSTLASELMVGWLADGCHLAGRTLVPVRLSLPGWDPPSPGVTPSTGQGLNEWLADQLVDGYAVPRTVASELVDDRRIVPILDGLDEMDPQGGFPARAQAALAELNSYRADNDDAPVVVTCRTERYASLRRAGDGLSRAATFHIGPVTTQQAIGFIEDRVVDGDRWRRVLEDLTGRPTSELALAMSTPWRLTLAVTAYEADRSLDPAGLLDLHGDEIERHLLSLYVQSVTTLDNRRQGRRYRPRPERVERWLTVLALYLDTVPRDGRASRTELVLPDLWRVAGNRLPRVVSGASAAIQAGLLVLAVSGFHLVWLGLLLVIIAGMAGCRTKSPPPVLMAAPLVGSRTGSGRLGAARFSLAVGIVFAYATVCVAVGLVALPVLWVIGVLPFVPILLVVPLGLLLRLGAAVFFPGFVYSRGFAYVAVPFYVVGYLGAAVVIYWYAKHRYQWFEVFKPVLVGLRRLLDIRSADPKFLGLHLGGIDRATSPRMAIRSDVVTDTTCVLAFAVAAFLSRLPVFRSRSTIWLSRGLDVVAGILLIASVVYLGNASRRYLALLVCKGGKLSSRPGRFLDWASEAGLVRLSGAAYQFRHAELQNWLAHHHSPPADVDVVCQKCQSHNVVLGSSGGLICRQCDNINIFSRCVCGDSVRVSINLGTSWCHDSKPSCRRWNYVALHLPVDGVTIDCSECGSWNTMTNGATGFRCYACDKVIYFVKCPTCKSRQRVTDTSPPTGKQLSALEFSCRKCAERLRRARIATPETGKETSLATLLSLVPPGRAP